MLPLVGVSALFLLLSTGVSYASLKGELTDCASLVVAAKYAFRPDLERNNHAEFKKFKNTPSQNPRVFSLDEEFVMLPATGEAMRFNQISRHVPFGHFMPESFISKKETQIYYTNYIDMITHDMRAIMFIKKGDYIKVDRDQFLLDDFVGAGNSAHFFKIVSSSEQAKLIRIPFLAPSRASLSAKRDGKSLSDYARLLNQEMVELSSRIDQLGLKRVQIVKYGAQFEYVITTQVDGYMTGRSFLEAFISSQSETHLSGYDRSQVFQYLTDALSVLGVPSVTKEELYMFQSEQADPALSRKVLIFTEHARNFMWDESMKEWVIIGWDHSTFEHLTPSKSEEKSYDNEVPPARQFPTVKQSDIVPDPKVTNPRQAAPKKMETVNEEELKKRAQEQTSQIKPKTKYRVIPKTTEQHDRRAKPKVNTEYEIPRRPQKITQPIPAAPWEETRDNGRLKPGKKDATRLVPHKKNPKQGE